MLVYQDTKVHIHSCSSCIIVGTDTVSMVQQHVCQQRKGKASKVNYNMYIHPGQLWKKEEHPEVGFEPTTLQYVPLCTKHRLYMREVTKYI